MDNNRSNVNFDIGKFAKRTAELLSSSSMKYISDTAPTTASLIKDTKNSINQVVNIIGDKHQLVTNTIKNIKRQGPVRLAYNWYMDQDDDSDQLSNIKLDIDDTDTSISNNIAEISESERNTNKLANTIVQSMKYQSDINIASISTLDSSITTLNASVTTGFNSLNRTITDKFNELISKFDNTAKAFAESYSNESEESDSSDKSKSNPILDMFKSGRFDLEKYTKAVKGNVINDPYIATMVTGFNMIKDEISTPEGVMGLAFDTILNKAFPKLKGQLSNFDKAFNNILLESLIRMGNSANPIIKNFGLSSNRYKADTSRSELNLHATKFDTITKEAITNAIPGYLRKIYEYISGNDMVYDYRSRSFRTSKSIDNEFYQASGNVGSLRKMSEKIRNRFNVNSANIDMTNLMFDLMMNDMSNRSYDDMAEQLDEFKSKSNARIYIQDLLKDIALTPADKKEISNFVKTLQELAGSSNGIVDLGTQIRMNNVTRTTSMQDFISNAENYNVDLSHLEDSNVNAIQGILSAYGYKNKISVSKDNIHKKAVRAETASGTEYANIALYQIFRRLDKGINVYQVGSSNERNKPFEKLTDAHLPPLIGYKPRKINDDGNSNKPFLEKIPKIKVKVKDDDINEDQQQYNGTDINNGVERLGRGERFGKWASYHGSKLRRAIFNGDMDDIKDVLYDAMSDIGNVVKTKGTLGISNINHKYGNPLGSIKHFFTGEGYTFEDTDENDNPVTKEIKSTKGADGSYGGVFGFIRDEFKMSFDKINSKSRSWLNDVKSYFDFGGSDPKERKAASKRKKLIFSTAGALAGAGILGGPIGLLIGATAGNALSMSDWGSTLKEKLFGYDKDGKPTGMLTKLADKVISPIQFQIGKTVSLLGAASKKYIFGPMSDMFMAIKDRITTGIKGFFSKTIGRVLGFAGKSLFNLISKGKNLISNVIPTTLIGKGARAAITTGGKIIGGAQNIATNVIAGNKAFHKLKKGETYTIGIGEKYAVKENGKTVVHTATNEIDVTDDSNILISTKNYIRNRKKQRNQQIKDELNESGYYDSSNTGIGGKIKGFFGGDYKKWKDREYERRKERRDRFKEATKPGDESIVTATKETSKNTAEIKENIKTTANVTEDIKQSVSRSEEAIINLNKLGSEKGSIFTHDDGLHTRLDKIIEIISGNNLNNSQIINSMSGAAATLVATSDSVSNEEFQTYSTMIDDSVKKNADINTSATKLKRLALMQQEKQENDKKDEKKEGLLDKIGNFLGGNDGLFGGLLGSGLGSFLGSGLSGFAKFIPKILKYGGIAALAYKLLVGKNGRGLPEIFDRLTSGLETFEDVINGTSDVSATTAGLNMTTGLADIKSNSTLSYLNPFVNLFHNQTTPAGDNITNDAMTKVKDDLLIQGPLRQLLYGSGFWSGVSDKLLKQSLTDEEIAKNLAKQGGFKNKAKSIAYDVKSRTGLSAADAADKMGQTDTLDTTTKGYRRTLTQISALNLASKGGGLVAGVASRLLGYDEEEAETISNTVNTGTSAILSANKIYTDAKNFANKFKKKPSATKTAWIDSIADKLDEFIKWIGEKVGLDDAFEAIGKTKIMSKFTNIANKTVTAFKDAIDDKIIGAINNKLTKIFGKNALSISTAGIAVAAGGALGLASGYCSTEHLFNVLPNEADGLMKTISTILGGILGAAEMTPFGFIIAIFDILDAILIAAPGIQKGLTQWIAEVMYGLLGDEQKLTEKQERMGTAKSNYESKYGITMNNATWNDSVNNTGFFDRIWRGKAQIDSEGNVIASEGGDILRKGGIKNWFVGQEYEYLTDANGNAIKDENGNFIRKTDANGNYIKKDKRIGDYISSGFNSVKRFFTGGDTYKTDENGNVIYDESGSAVVASTEKNLFGRIGDAITGNKDVIDQAVNASVQLSVAPYMALQSSIKMFNDGLNSSKDTPILDDQGNPLVDDEGNPITQSNIRDTMFSQMNKMMAVAINPFLVFSGLIKDWKKVNWKEMSKYSVVNNITNDNIPVGGPSDPNEGSEDATIDPTTLMEDNQPEGGNPLNKPFVVTSSYGINRDVGATSMHHGIDIIPNDYSGQADIGSRFKGTIHSVKSDVPKSDTAYKSNGSWYYSGSNPAGNYVTIDTDSGYRIKNMHLMPGSIPSNIKPGARVNVGDKIGSMGSTGWSTGNHLHYQIEKAPYGDSNTINPYDSITTGKQLDTFKATSKTNHAVNGSTIESSFTSSNDTNDDNKKDNKLATSWSRLLSTITRVGGKFLSKLTGGMLGSEEDSEDNNATINGGSSDNTTNNGSDSFKNYSGSIHSASDFLKLCAKEIGTKEVPAKSNNIKYNKWFYGKVIDDGRHPWDTTFVEWCFDQAGLTLPYKVDSADKLWNYYSTSSKDSIVQIPKPGDIVILKGTSKNKSAIVESVKTSNSITVIEGNCSGTDKRGSMVKRNTYSSNIIGYIRVVDFEEMKKVFEEGNKIKDGNVDQLYAYLRSKGYSHTEISGILGCWSAESSNTARTVETAYLKPKDFDLDTLMEDRDAMNDYVKNFVWPKTRQAGYEIQEAGYKGTDGNLYPGIGYAQWTGPRAQNLLSYSKQSNRKWDSPALQLDMMDMELNSNYQGTRERLKNAKTPEDAVQVWAKGYEGFKPDQKRIDAGKQIYEKYKNWDNEKGVNTEGESVDIDTPMGGGITDDSTASTYNPSFKSKSELATIERRSTNPKAKQIARSKQATYSVSSYKNNYNQSPLITSSENISSDDSELIVLLNSILTELKKVSSNTGSSNNLLDQLNQKDFMDQGVRSAIGSMSKYKNRRNVRGYTELTRTNTRMISSLARP